MASTLHFISGLPRSGSTLLCALLKQNPRFVASMTSPVAGLCGSLLQKMSGASEFSTFFSDNRRSLIIRSVIEAYYADAINDHVVFDTNRTWTAKLSLLKMLYPNSRVICCVREVNWIIDSVERLTRVSAFQPSRLFNYKSGGTVYSRVDTLMNPETGLIGLAWNSLRESWFSEDASRLIVIKYDTLAKQPQRVLDCLYRELGEPPFKHDFGNVSYDEPAYDAELGIPGMHKVRPEVAYQQRHTCLPPDLFSKYAETNFWLNPNLNPRGVVIA